jgi:sec-independent protein translocase protein TatB
MFDLDVGKILIVGIVALLVIGPKDLPRVLRTIGQVVGKMRRMATDVQNQFNDAIKEADLDSVKKELGAINDSANIDISLSPTTAMRGHLPTATEGSKEIAAASANLATPGEATYASPEMKEYLALSPESFIGTGVAFPHREDSEKKEVANENAEPMVNQSAQL